VIPRFQGQDVVGARLCQCHSVELRGDTVVASIGHRTQRIRTAEPDDDFSRLLEGLASHFGRLAQSLCVALDSVSDQGSLGAAVAAWYEERLHAGSSFPVADLETAVRLDPAVSDAVDELLDWVESDLREAIAALQERLGILFEASPAIIAPLLMWLVDGSVRRVPVGDLGAVELFTQALPVLLRSTPRPLCIVR